MISVWLIHYNQCKLTKMTFFVPFSKNGTFKLRKCGLSPKGLRILRSVTRIMVKTSLSIRRFWGKGEKWKRKRERGEGEKRLTQMLLLEPSTPT